MEGIKQTSAINIENYAKYNACDTVPTMLYVVYQFLIALTTASALLFLHTRLPMQINVALASFDILTLLSCGGLLEKRTWIKFFEYFRLTLSFLIIYLIKDVFSANGLIVTIIAVQSLSLFLFFLLQRSQNVKKNTGSLASGLQLFVFFILLLLAMEFGS